MQQKQQQSSASDITNHFIPSFDFRYTSEVQPPPLQCHNYYCIARPTILHPTQFAGQDIYYCPTCFKHYEQRNCCYFCGQVYSSDEQSFLDGKQWVQCDEEECGKWMHIDCECEFGVIGLKLYLEESNFKYLCPWCRQSNKTSRRKKSERKSSESDQPSKNRKSPVYQEPIIIKQGRMAELLKKYGGFSLVVSLEEYTHDCEQIFKRIKQSQ